MLAPFFCSKKIVYTKIHIPGPPAKKPTGLSGLGLFRSSSMLPYWRQQFHVSGSATKKTLARRLNPPRICTSPLAVPAFEFNSALA